MTTSRSKNWFITGISSGLGQALAHAALERGDRVVGTVRSADAAAAFSRRSAGRSIGLECDVTDHAAIRRAVAAAEEKTGGIDILVNNAGYSLVGGVEEATRSEVRRQFEVNVFGALTVMQAALPFMRARRAGRIVNITSVSGLVGWPSLGIYTASKFALEGLSETLALELEPLGIKVIMIEPGGLRTDFATRSRALVARTIDDYDATVGACRRTLESHAGHEPGDPVRAAKIIVDVATSDAPPLRLLLGTDALGYADRKLDSQMADIRAWEAVSRESDFPSG